MWHLARRLTQIGAAFLLLSPLAGLTFFLGTYTASLLVGRLHLADPFAALQVGLLPLAIAALPIVLLNLLLGRVFCGWICPLGLLLEWVDRLRRTLGLRERTLPRWARWPLAGLILFGSLLAGQPLFEWFSPQSNLARLLLFGLAWEALLLPAIILADLLISRRLWCNTLCPAGVTFGLLARSGLLRVELDPSRCHRCGACLNTCPQGRSVLQEAVSGRGSRQADPDACLSCGECLDACPENGLSFRFGLRHDPGRRAALISLGAASALALLAAGRPVRAERPRLALRPPGALPEADFLALCVRCGKCAQVCPRQAIHLQQGAPVITPRAEACDLCRICPDVCPTGALTLLPNQPVQMGSAQIDQNRCLAWTGTLCRSCFAVCPVQGQAITIELDERAAVWRPVVHADQCTGCGLCEHVCASDPAAITIRPANPTPTERG